MSDSELLQLMNVGKATLSDLHQLNIYTVQQLAQANASELFNRLQCITGKKQDPCVWDVFAAIIHEAKTGEKTKWWQWTQIRKSRRQY